jgi:hypothetical protein
VDKIDEHRKNYAIECVPRLKSEHIIEIVLGLSNANVMGLLLIVRF